MIPLHNHTMYSALDGFSTPEEIVQRCKELEVTACGLTDHGVITGHLPFAKAMVQADLKPIFGCELYHGLNPAMQGSERDQAHLIALAMTNEGLANLWSLINATAERDHFHYVGRTFWYDLEKYRDGLVVTSACGGGLVPRSIINDDYDPLNRYLDIFGDNFYIEIHTYPQDQIFKDKDSEIECAYRLINEALVSIAQERGIPMVYANDAHYAFPSQYEYHDLYIAVQTRDSIHTPVDERSQWHPPQALAMLDEAEVREALSYLPDSVVDEVIANSDEIAQRANVILPGFKRHLPAFIPSECPWLTEAQKDYTPEDLFIDLVEDGIIKRYGENAAQEVWDRAIYEVDTLIRDEIHHYFLMGWDEMQAAQHYDIETGPGRGSSAGSIVAYALGITDVDPLHYQLIFERFWNSGRAKGFPDIDSDFSRRSREAMIAYLEKRWGKDRVCAIGTTGYMKPKAVIDKLARGCGIEFKEAEELKKIVGKTTKIDILGHKQIGWNPELEPGKVYYVKNDVGTEIDAWISAVPERRVLRARFIRMCEVCCSRVEQYGIHASGIVISDEPLPPLAPAYRRGGKEKGKPATMFAMDDIDKLGLVKLDVLGLRTLDVLEFWRQMMADKGITVNWSGLDKEEHPYEMWKMLHDGFTAGIFQVEDGYGRQLCKALEPVSTEDLSVIGALNRPGPIQAGIPDRYIARKNGVEEVTYIHSRIQELAGDILDPTYGLFVYQEQIIAFFNALGYTLSESDAMRKIMGKKQPQDLNAVRDGLGEWEGRGYFKMAEASDIPSDIADQVWRELEGFADYCFNKSHTVAYGIIGFRTLFAKYYGPAHFYAASLKSLEHSTDGEKRKAMVPQYVNECRRLGIEVAPPTIWGSRGYSHVDDEGVLRFGFYDIKGVANSGPYIEEIVKSGQLDLASADQFMTSFEDFNASFLNMKKEKVTAGEWLPNEHRSPKQKLGVNKIKSLAQVGAWGTTGSLTDQQEIEQELLGVIITDNSQEVLERNAEEIAQCDAWDDLLTSYIAKLGDGNEVFEYTVCGIVTGIEEKTARKSGNRFGIVTVEYEQYTVDFGVYTNKWKTHKFLFRPRIVGIFTLQHSAPTEYGESYKFIRGHVLK